MPASHFWQVKLRREIPIFGCFNSLAFSSLAKYVKSMPAVTLKAHFNGKQIVLDEPFDLPPTSPLMVTVLSSEKSPEEAQWHEAAAHGLTKAYGENENFARRRLVVWLSLAPYCFD